MPGVLRADAAHRPLLGGSFNPAHAGHRHISLEALEAPRPRRGRWLVSPQNPLKSGDGMEPLPTHVARARQVASHPRIRIDAPS